MGKYGNKKAFSQDGRLFDSKAERDRYEQLRLMERSGNIRNLYLQPEFVVLPAFIDFEGKRHRPIKYRADFEYLEGNRRVIEDVKGIETAVFKLKKKMLLRGYPDIDFRIVKSR